MLFGNLITLVKIYTWVLKGVIVTFRSNVSMAATKALHPGGVELKPLYKHPLTPLFLLCSYQILIKHISSRRGCHEGKISSLQLALCYLSKHYSQYGLLLPKSCSFPHMHKVSLSILSLVCTINYCSKSLQLDLEFYQMILLSPMPQVSAC